VHFRIIFAPDRFRADPRSLRSAADTKTLTKSLEEYIVSALAG
jgi:hypothetical protein